MNTRLRPKTARASSTERARARALIFLLLLAASASPAAASSADAPPRKRLVVLRRGETADGARFTLTSDSVLDDYRSYAEGERLFVLVPRAGLSSTRGELSHASGFADLRVEERVDGLLISFRLQTGTTVSVSQNFNRLDVVFVVNERPA